MMLDSFCNYSFQFWYFYCSGLIVMHLSMEQTQGDVDSLLRELRVTEGSIFGKPSVCMKREVVS